MFPIKDIYAMDAATLFDKDNPSPSPYHASLTTDVWGGGDLLADSIDGHTYLRRGHHDEVTLTNKKISHAWRGHRAIQYE